MSFGFDSYISSVSQCVNNYASGMVTAKFLTLSPTEAQRQDGTILTDVQTAILAKTALVALSVLLALSTLSPLGAGGAFVGFTLSGLYAFDRLLAEQCPLIEGAAKIETTVNNAVKELFSWFQR